MRAQTFPQRKKIMSFETLGLSRPILDALSSLSISTPTPIQLQAIPPALEGRDIVGLAQTGTGKTAAFSLPIIEKLSAGRRAGPRKVHALIVTPTRELATQIQVSIRGFSRLMKLKTVLAVGGNSIRPQIKFLLGGADILIATPGRLEDLMRQGAVSLNETEIVVLDEGDQMLDIGFMPAIKRILSATSSTRQTMLFSATMPKEIRQLSERYLRNPVEISVVPTTRTADRIDQGVIHISNRSKTTALSALIHAHEGNRIIVFTRTKHGADKVVKRLDVDNIEAAAIHGNKSQGQRERALKRFRDGQLHVLVATDIAARGIDVPDVTLVVNHDLPDVPEVYVHRIGRTARAGKAGLAVAFCSPEERTQLRDIERLIKIDVPVMAPPQGLEAEDMSADAEANRHSRTPSNRNSRGHNGGGRGNAGPGRGPKSGPSRAKRNGSGRSRPEGVTATNGENRSAPAGARPNRKFKHRKGQSPSGTGRGRAEHAAN